MSFLPTPKSKPHLPPDITLLPLTRLDSLIRNSEADLNNRPQQTILDMRQILFEAVHYQDTVLMYHAGIVLSRCFGFTGASDSCDFYASQSVRLAEASADSGMIGLAYFFKASSSSGIGLKDKGEAYRREMLPFLQHSRHYEGRARYLMEIATQTGEQDPEAGRKGFEQAAAFALAYQDHLLAGHAILSASGLVPEDDPDLQLSYLDRVDSLNQVAQDTFLMVLSQNFRAETEFQQGDTAYAMQLLHAALELMNQANNSGFVAFFNYQIGEREKDFGHLGRAIPYFRTAWAISRERNEYEMVASAAGKLAECFELLGPVDSVALWYQRLSGAQDSLYQAEMDRAVREMQYIYRTEEQEAEIQLLTSQNRLQQLEASQLREERNRQLGLGIGLGLVLLLVIGFLVYALRAARIRSRQEAELLQKDKELQARRMAAIAQQSQNAALESLLQGGELERQRMARELHDSIGIRLSLLKLNLEKGVPLAEASGLLDRICSEVRHLSHSMMPHALQQMGLSAAVEDIVSLAQGGGPDISLVTSGEEGEIPAETRLHLYRMLQECLHNALKHAQAAEIMVQLIFFPDHISLLVEDNGRGFAVDGGPAAGMGLDSLKSRAQVIGAQLQIESQAGVGTSVYINWQR